MVGVDAGGYSSQNGGNSNNTLIGADAIIQTAAQVQDAIAIGYKSIVTSSNTAQIGGTTANGAGVNLSVAYGVTAGSYTANGARNGQVTLTIPGFDLYGHFKQCGSYSRPVCCCFQHEWNRQWVTSSGGSGTPGSNQQLQYDNAGSFGGVPNTSVTASSITFQPGYTVAFFGIIALKTTSSVGGMLSIWNSGGNNRQIEFDTDSGAFMGQVNALINTYFRIDNETAGGDTQLQTGGTTRLDIGYTNGNTGINETALANSQLGVLGATADAYTAAFSTTAAGPYTLDISTNGHINSQSVLGATVTSCGTSPSYIGSDAAATITTGSGSPTTCNFTFANKYITAPTCVASDTLDTAVVQITSITNATVSMAFSASLNSGKIFLICIGSD